MTESVVEIPPGRILGVSKVEQKRSTHRGIAKKELLVISVLTSAEDMARRPRKRKRMYVINEATKMSKIGSLGEYYGMFVMDNIPVHVFEQLYVDN